jgi:phage shock protein PspC (stress-responsive transcriptional regulator)
MTTNTEYTAPTPPPPLPPAPSRPPLRRSQSDKVIAGVAGGVARWLGIDPVIVRVVLVVLAVFGGSGLLLYAIGWLFIPTEGTSTSSADAFFRDASKPGSTARTVAIVLGVIAAVIIGLNLIGWAFGSWGGGGSVLLLLAVGGLVLYLLNRPQPSAPAPITAAPDVAEPLAYAYGGSGQYPGYVASGSTPAVPVPPRERSYLGLVTLSIALIATGVLVWIDSAGVADLPAVVIPGVALAILGAGILVGAWIGRARWLLWLAIPTLFVTMIASVVPSDAGAWRASIEGGIGDRAWTPTTVAEAAVAHRLGIGSATLDLTDLAIPPGTASVPVTAEVGVGELVVLVPEDARVALDADVQLGELRIDGVPRTNDASPEFAGTLPGGSDLGPVIDLTVSTTLGSLEVSRA